MEKYRVKVHRKGIIVIQASIRRRLGIHEGSHLELVVDNDNLQLIIPKSLRDLFGSDGEKAIEVARLISSSRRAEVEKEISS